MTNQVSEDKLIKSKTDWSTPYDEWLLPTLNRFRYGGAIECRAIPSEIQLNIESLIRTEKLKLLAEVRERVVGEDEPGVTNIMIAAEHAEQRNVLTKLEAEL
jgi:hypothetical protein